MQRALPLKAYRYRNEPKNDKMLPSQVRYVPYDHIGAAICLFDKPDVFGKARRGKDTSDVIATSVFEEYRGGSYGGYLIVSAIEHLIREVSAKWVILSYSSGGRATAEEIVEPFLWPVKDTKKIRF